MFTLFFSVSPLYSIYLPAQIVAGLRGRLQGRCRSCSWCCVLLWCGAVFVWTRHERAIYNGETCLLSVLYTVVNSMSYHSSDHKQVTIVTIPGEDMTGIWNKCIVGSCTNCDVSQTINKTN